MRVAIMISGGGSNMVRLVESMTGNHPARPVLVVSNRPNAGGLDKAAALNVPTAVVDHRSFQGDCSAFEDALKDVLIAHRPDLICLAGFMRILAPEFVAHFAGQMINIHPSLLPKYPGLKTHARALEAGDKRAGCTVHEVTGELDCGPILGQATVPVQPGDTAESLATRVLEQEHILYPAVLRRLAQGDRNCLTLP